MLVVPPNKLGVPTPSNLAAVSTGKAAGGIPIPHVHANKVRIPTPLHVAVVPVLATATAVAHGGVFTCVKDVVTSIGRPVIHSVVLTAEHDFHNPVLEGTKPSSVNPHRRRFRRRCNQQNR